MKNLGLTEAKKIAQDILGQLSPTSRRDFLLIHSEKVGKTAGLIAQKLQIDDKLFEIAGWVHDIGYARNSENHGDFAIPLLEELGYEVSEALKDCILNHGNGKNPKTSEGRIFQLADKLSIFDFATIETILNHGDFPMKKDDINFLKMMSEKSFELLENFSI
jgi:HD superfamily phosphodiesterase